MQKTALVTGAAKRIGRSIALHLASIGYDIAIHYNDSEKDAVTLKDEVENKGQKALLFKCDLLITDQVKLLIPNIVKKMNNLSLIINSASIFKPSSLDMNLSPENDYDWFDAHFKINLKAPLLLSCSFAKYVDNGLIINLTDAKVSDYETEFFDYLLSKKALHEATKMAAVKFAPKIRVNGIAPGWIKSPDYLKEDECALLKKIPLNQQGNEGYIIEALNYIIQNDYVTGDIMYVDGGLAIA